MSVEIGLFLCLCGVGFLYMFLINYDKGKSFKDIMRDIYYGFFPK